MVASTIDPPLPSVHISIELSTRGPASSLVRLRQIENQIRLDKSDLKLLTEIYKRHFECT